MNGYSCPVRSPESSRDITHPINSNTREKIQNLILEKYEEVMAEDVVADNA